MEIKVIASGSSGNAYTVTDGKTTLLLEAGLPVHKLSSAVDLAAVDACVISHEHMDHSKAAADLSVRYGIPIIASPGTLQALRLENSFLAEPIGELKELRCKSMVIKSFTVPHDAVQPFGYIIRSAGGDKLMFLTDAFYIPIKPPENLTHLMIECNYSMELLEEAITSRDTPHSQRERIRRSHMSLETLCEWIEQHSQRLQSLQDIYLLHISSRNGDPEAFSRRVRQITGKVVRHA